MCRSRNANNPGKPIKKTKVEEEDDDPTRDMEDPPPEPTVTEVTTGSKIQPSKGGVYMDLDEEATEKTEKTEGPVSVSSASLTRILSCIALPLKIDYYQHFLNFYLFYKRGKTG